MTDSGNGRYPENPTALAPKPTVCNEQLAYSLQESRAYMDMGENGEIIIMYYSLIDAETLGTYWKPAWSI